MSTLTDAQKDSLRQAKNTYEFVTLLSPILRSAGFGDTAHRVLVLGQSLAADTGIIYSARPLEITDATTVEDLLARFDFELKVCRQKICKFEDNAADTTGADATYEADDKEVALSIPTRTIQEEAYSSKRFA